MMSHHPTVTRVTNPHGTVTTRNDNAYHARSLETKLPPEQILPSIEQPFQKLRTRNYFQELNGGGIHNGSPSVTRNIGQDGWRLPVTRAPASSNPDVGRKRRRDNEGPLPPSYSSSKIAAGTVLIPLEGYNERQDEGARNRDFQHNHTPAAYRTQELPGRYPVITQALDLHKIGIAEDHSGRLQSLLGPMRGPDGQYQRLPHMQVQLNPGAAGFRSVSPINLTSSQSDYYASPRSQPNHVSAHKASRNPSLIRNSNNFVEDGYAPQPSIYDQVFDAPADSRAMPKQPEIADMAIYNRHLGSSRSADDLWVGRDNTDRAYSESRPASRGRIARETKEPGGTHLQHSVGPGILAGHGHHYTELPLRNLASNDQAGIDSFRPVGSYDKGPLPPRLRQEEIYRYVISFPSLMY